MTKYYAAEYKETGTVYELKPDEVWAGENYKIGVGIKVAIFDSKPLRDEWISEKSDSRIAVSKRIAALYTVGQKDFGSYDSRLNDWLHLKRVAPGELQLEFQFPDDAVWLMCTHGIMGFFSHGASLEDAVFSHIGNRGIALRNRNGDSYADIERDTYAVNDDFTIKEGSPRGIIGYIKRIDDKEIESAWRI